MAKKVFKRLEKLFSKIQNDKAYGVEQGVEMVKSLASAKFDEKIGRASCRERVS